MVPFNTSSETVKVTDYYLVSPVKDPGFLEYMAGVGKPFELIAWFSIIAMISYVGIAYGIVRDTRNDDDGDNKSGTKGCKPCALFERIVHTIYVSLRSFAAVDVVESGDRPNKAEKIMISGFVIFALVIMSIYTANLAAFLLVKVDSLKYSSMVDIVQDKEATVCVGPEVLNKLQYEYPTVKFETMNENIDDIYAQSILDEVARRGKNCSAGIISMFDYFYVNNYGNGNFCKDLKMIKDTAVLEINSNIFVSPRLPIDIVEALFEAIDLSISLNFDRWDSIYNQWFNYNTYDQTILNNTSLPPQLSRDIPGDDERRNRRFGRAISGNGQGYEASISSETCSFEERGRSFSMKELSFPLIVTLTLTTFGLLIFLFETYAHKWRVRKRYENSYAFRKSVFPTMTSVSDEIEVLEDEASKLLISDLIKIIENAVSISEKETIDDAINMLPDRTALTALYIDINLSREGRIYRRIMNLPTSALYRILCMSDYHDIKEVSQMINNKDHRSALVNGVMVDPHARYEALEIFQSYKRSICLENRISFVELNLEECEPLVEDGQFGKLTRNEKFRIVEHLSQEEVESHDESI